MYLMKTQPNEIYKWSSESVFIFVTQVVFYSQWLSVYLDYFGGFLLGHFVKFLITKNESSIMYVYLLKVNSILTPIL